MPEQRVSIFVSHKVDIHDRAAKRIKAILESRAERLDLHICEQIPAGDGWRKWIQERISHSQILLVLVPHVNADLKQIAIEIDTFRNVCPRGRLIILQPPSGPTPELVADIARDIETVPVSAGMIKERFLEPLYRDRTLTGLDAPLNPRVADLDIGSDARAIQDALLDSVGDSSKLYGESIEVDVRGVDVTKPLELDEALVLAPNGCSQILNWCRPRFTWSELRARAAEERGKGTFWLTEIEQVMMDVARQSRPRVMTSTFRGCGETAGQIFKPQLSAVDFAGEKPLRYRFVFYEALVPELTRGPNELGEVFNLIHLATRMRWEVLNPFLVNVSLVDGAAPSRLNLSAEAQSDLIGRVKGSLRAIELEAERHHIVDAAMDAFADEERDQVANFLSQREKIQAALRAAVDGSDFGQLMQELARALELNADVTVLFASRFLRLVRENARRDREKLKRNAVPESAARAAV